LCESRWVERIDGISDFCSSFETVFKILDGISDWDDINASSIARLLTLSCLALLRFRAPFVFIFEPNFSKNFP
jgi:hypothetical protein